MSSVRIASPAASAKADFRYSVLEAIEKAYPKPVQLRSQGEPYRGPLRVKVSRHAKPYWFYPPTVKNSSGSTEQAAEGADLSADQCRDLSGKLRALFLEANIAECRSAEAEKAQEKLG